MFICQPMDEEAPINYLILFYNDGPVPFLQKGQRCQRKLTDGTEDEFSR